MITELKPTNLIAVEVPKDAKDFCVKEHIVRNAIDSRDEYELNFQNGNKEEYLILRYNYKIVGTVTKDKIGFDVEKAKPFSGDKFFNHLKDVYVLLAANGLYFENPVGYPTEDEYEGKDWAAQAIIDDKAAWQSYEEKLIRGELLILEKL